MGIRQKKLAMILFFPTQRGVNFAMRATSCTRMYTALLESRMGNCHCTRPEGPISSAAYRGHSTSMCDSSGEKSKRESALYPICTSTGVETTDLASVVKRYSGAESAYPCSHQGR